MDNTTEFRHRWLRDHAIFLVLLHTALRISELLTLDLDQYRGKHLLNVKRKGRNGNSIANVLGSKRATAR